MSDATCPICRAATLEAGEGRLDQSGDSFLPTVTLRCPVCEYARYRPAVGAKWVSAAAPPARAKPAATQAAARRTETEPLAA